MLNNIILCLKHFLAEKYRVHLIRYLRFYYHHGADTYAGELSSTK